MTRLVVFASRHSTECLISVIGILMIGIYVFTLNEVRGEGGVNDRLRDVERAQDRKSSEVEKISDKVEERTEALNAKFDSHAKAIETEIAGIRTEMDLRFTSMEKLMEELISAQGMED